MKFNNTQLGCYERIYINILIFILIFVAPITAQPSGGPYGPIQKNYDLPVEKPIHPTVMTLPQVNRFLNRQPLKKQ